MKRKLLAAISLTTILSTAVTAHTNETYHMMNGNWHNGMWGTGMWWGGGLFMLLLWVLVILGIIYLGQKILDNTNKGEKE